MSDQPNQPNAPPPGEGNPQSHSAIGVPHIPTAITTTANDKTGKGHYWKMALAVFLGIGGFFTVTGLYNKAVSWLEDTVDKKVDRKLTDPVILRKIAAESRPALIFNSDESIRQNLGAAPLIADNGKAIHITKEKDGWPTQISIEFTKVVPDAPILTCLDESAIILPKPGKGFSWDFDVREEIQHGFVKTNLWLFRLELAP
jgi:hypothetical protein